MRILLTSLRILKTADGADLSLLIGQLEKVVTQMTQDETTTVSKFQQEVF